MPIGVCIHHLLLGVIFLMDDDQCLGVFAEAALSPLSVMNNSVATTFDAVVDASVTGLVFDLCFHRRFLVLLRDAPTARLVPIENS